MKYSYLLNQMRLSVDEYFDVVEELNASQFGAMIRRRPENSLAQSLYDEHFETLVEAKILSRVPGDLHYGRETLTR